MFPRTFLSRLHKAALVSVLALAAFAPAAGAPRDAIIDPRSPAGTEYDLPLDRARDEASGGSVGGRDSIRGGGSGSGGSGAGGGAPASGAGAGGAAAGGGGAPLFGAGIAAGGGSADPGSDADGRGGSGEGAGGPGSSRSGGGSPLAQAGEAAKSATEPAARTGSPGDTNAARTWLVGLAAAILAAGGLVGFVVRRASRRTEAPSYVQ